MPLIDQQRRHATIGTIRMGQKVLTGKTDRNGKPSKKPVKLTTFRITSPNQDLIDQVAARFGGTVAAWDGHRGTEWETVTTTTKIPVLVPRQNIDPNYEFWGNGVKLRFCNGNTEKIRNKPCLCRTFGNHDHNWYNGRCMICSLPQTWKGEPHEHDFADRGSCTICGCGRICKPTTRLSVMIHGVAGLGYFKIESHGINAALELPALSELISTIPANTPLPGVLSMRYEERIRIVIKDGRETTQVHKFFVPDLLFPWLRPENLYAGSYAIAAAAKAGLDNPVFQGLALEAGKSTAAATPTRDDVVGWVRDADSMDALREVWQMAKDAGHLDDGMKGFIEERIAKLGNVVDAEIVE